MKNETVTTEFQIMSDRIVIQRCRSMNSEIKFNNQTALFQTHHEMLSVYFDITLV